MQRFMAILVGALAAILVSPSAFAQSGGEEKAPASLFELLETVQQGLQAERVENQRRIANFEKRKADQERVLAEAKAALARFEAQSEQLETTYNENEVQLAEDEERLKQRLGQMGELFGVVRQVATDAGGSIWDSLISSQLGQRKELLDRLGRSKELPSTEDLERLWFELQREMTEQGEVVRYTAPVLTIEGDVVEKDVIRAGPFTAIADGKYLFWEPGEARLRELTRQPPSRYVETADTFQDLQSGIAALAVDPSRGSLLAALTDTPSAQERVEQGGAVGYTILVLGFFALILGLFRWTAVTIASRKVAAQRKRDRIDTGNPLGRVLAVAEENQDVDTETLELKLDEVVMRETSRLERFQWLVRTVSVIAPLLGLLGTVTGMIQTFQAITLFGTGDPKMMAGGISEALVTTMLGLITAIPLVLLSDTLRNSTRRVVDVLDEHSAGLLALRAGARDA